MNFTEADILKALSLSCLKYLSVKKFYFCIVTTLTIHIENSNQDAAIRTLLEALHMQYDELESSTTETEYLNSTKAMVAHLEKSNKEAKQGDTLEINLDTLLYKP
jgi:PHD/YefM family antitoxin component YafN of YafNO toxin-antitoxin module